ncbi:MAG: hypothetical protein WDW38_004883 [Sanguina aurantia]
MDPFSTGGHPGSQPPTLQHQYHDGSTGADLLGNPGALQPGVQSDQHYHQHLASMHATHQRLEELHAYQMQLAHGHTLPQQIPPQSHLQQQPGLMLFDMTPNMLMHIAPDASHQHHLTNAPQPPFLPSLLLQQQPPPQQQQQQQLLLPSHLDLLQHHHQHQALQASANDAQPLYPQAIATPLQQLQQQQHEAHNHQTPQQGVGTDMPGSGDGEEEDPDDASPPPAGGRKGKRAASQRVGGPRKDRLALNFKGIPLLNAGYAHSWNLTRGSQVKVQLEVDGILLPEVHDRELRPASKTSVRSFQTQRISRHHGSGLFHRGWRRLGDGSLALVLSSADSSRLPQPPKPCDSLSTKPVAAHRSGADIRIAGGLTAAWGLIPGPHSVVLEMDGEYPLPACTATLTSADNRYPDVLYVTELQSTLRGLLVGAFKRGWRRLGDGTLVLVAARQDNSRLNSTPEAYKVIGVALHPHTHTVNDALCEHSRRSA